MGNLYLFYISLRFKSESCFLNEKYKGLVIDTLVLLGIIA
jgi:hypothetical protein